MYRYIFTCMNTHQRSIFSALDQYFIIIFCIEVMKLKKTDVPGEMGKPVIIPESQKQAMKEKFKINQFNLMASDIISPNRSLPDIRMDA